MLKADQKDIASYRSDEDFRSAIERKFIHIGEVMSQLRREFPDVASRFADAGRIVDFRNFIIHRYWDVDDLEVWLTLTTKVTPLLLEIQAVLAEESL